jgi:hypothetical protein
MFKNMEPDRERFYARERSTYGELTNWFLELKKMSEENNKPSLLEASNTDIKNDQKKRRHVVLKNK